MRYLSPRIRGRLWLLDGSQKHFADKALWRLGEDHFHRMGHVLWLKHSGRVFRRVRGEIGGHGSRADRADPYAIRAQILGRALSKSQQSPFGCAINAASGKGVFAGERSYIDDVSGATGNHSR